MKTKQKLLFNTRCKIQTVKLLLNSKCNLTILEKPNSIFKTNGKISYKNFTILKHYSVLRGPILQIDKFVGKIQPTTAKYLLRSTSVVKLTFNINKKDYYDFCPLILDNIEDLYSRIVKLYSVTKNHLISKGLEYVENTYDINEKIFKRILNNIEACNFNKYSDITDKFIITEIIKYFRSSS